MSKSSTTSRKSEETLYKLGQGSFGCVEKIRIGDRWYARKTMLGTDELEGISYAFIRECDIYSRFHCTFIPNVCNMQIQNHRIVILMGLADMSLAHYIHRDPKPAMNERIDMAKRLLWTGLNCVNYLHKYNVLHRDIKPDNILLSFNADETFNLYVSDLGSARFSSTQYTRLTSEMGTKCYRPQEMTTEKYGKQADVYCLGVSVVHLIEGDTPNEKDSEDPIKSQAEWMRLWKKWKAYLPGNLYELVSSMILLDPVKRITVTASLKHDLFHGSKIPGVPLMQYILPRNYLNTLNISGDLRQVWIEHMINLGHMYKYENTTLIHAVHLFDDFLGNINAETFNTECLEMYASVSVWVSGKYFEKQTIRLQHLKEFMQNRFAAKDILLAEENLLITLRFRIVRRPVNSCFTAKTSIGSLKYILGAPEYLESVIKTRKSPRIISGYRGYKL